MSWSVWGGSPKSRAGWAYDDLSPWQRRIMESSSIVELDANRVFRGQESIDAWMVWSSWELMKELESEQLKHEVTQTWTSVGCWQRQKYVELR